MANSVLKGSFKNLVHLLEWVLQTVVGLLDSICFKVNAVYRKYPVLLMPQSWGFGYFAHRFFITSSLLQIHMTESGRNTWNYISTGFVNGALALMIIRAHFSNPREHHRASSLSLVRAGMLFFFRSLVSAMADAVKATEWVDGWLALAVIFYFLMFVSFIKFMGVLDHLGAGDAMISTAGVFCNVLVGEDSPVMKFLSEMAFTVTVFYREHRAGLQKGKDEGMATPQLHVDDTTPPRPASTMTRPNV